MMIRDLQKQVQIMMASVFIKAATNGDLRFETLDFVVDVILHFLINSLLRSLSVGTG
jgi:hypothetical protein